MHSKDLETQQRLQGVIQKHHETLFIKVSWENTKISKSHSASQLGTADIQSSQSHLHSGYKNRKVCWKIHIMAKWAEALERALVSLCECWQTLSNINQCAKVFITPPYDVCKAGRSHTLASVFHFDRVARWDTAGGLGKKCNFRQFGSFAVYYWLISEGDVLQMFSYEAF